MSTKRRVLLLLLGLVILPVFASEAQVFPGKDWEAATPESRGLDARKLEQAVRFLEAHSGRDGVEELFIARHGYVVWEGDSTHIAHGVWSLTKSFTSTILGLLIDGGIISLDTPAHTFVPALSEYYGGVTLQHFATMTSGYRAIGDEPQGTYRHGPSRTPLLPSPDPLFAPGEQFAYWDSAMNQFAHVLTQAAGEPLDSLFQRRIGDEIGLKKAAWSWGYIDQTGTLPVVAGAGNHTRINISASDLARFGLLFLNQGAWQGKQLISKDWVTAATAVQVPASVPLAGFVDQGPGTYGFNWWVNGIDSTGARKWPEAPPGTFSASGYNNNDLFILPEWDLVIVRLGLDQNDHPITDAEYNTFLKMVGEAFVDKK